MGFTCRRHVPQGFCDSFHVAWGAGWPPAHGGPGTATAHKVALHRRGSHVCGLVSGRCRVYIGWWCPTLCDSIDCLLVVLRGLIRPSHACWSVVHQRWLCCSACCQGACCWPCTPVATPCLKPGLIRGKHRVLPEDVAALCTAWSLRGCLMGDPATYLLARSSHGCSPSHQAGMCV